MRRYLIVDDNPALAENVTEVLSEAGAQADVASCGGEALAKCARTRYDAIVCDMRMPAMNGAEVVQRLRALDPDLPAIVATAYTTDEQLAAAQREGLLAVLPKPLPLPRLVELLAAARRGGLVAFVGDDPALTDGLAEALSQRGFAAVAAGAGRKTVGALRPFAALVDLRVPDAMARLAERFPGLPVIPLDPHADSSALVDRVEALYPAHGRP